MDLLTSPGSPPLYVDTVGKAFDAARPTVVFVHGAQHDHSVWILQSRYLANHGYNVLALDLPGHMRSPGPPLASVDETEDAEDAEDVEDTEEAEGSGDRPTA